MSRNSSHIKVPKCCHASVSLPFSERVGLAYTVYLKVL